MDDIWYNCLLVIVGLAGSFVGLTLANVTVGLMVWVCTKMEQAAQQSKRRR